MMKTVLLKNLSRSLAVTMTLVSLAATPALAAKDSTCKVNLSDMTITGRGTSSDKAFEDAATQCFDQRSARYKAKHGQLDEETGLIYIDQCANVRCS